MHQKANLNVSQNDSKANGPKGLNMNKQGVQKKHHHTEVRGFGGMRGCVFLVPVQDIFFASFFTEF